MSTEGVSYDDSDLLFVPDGLMLGLGLSPGRSPGTEVGPFPLRRLLRFAAVAAVGLIALAAGLLWDASMHSADRMLAIREGLFSLANPAHALFIVGVFLIAAGLAGVVALVVRAVPTLRSCTPAPSPQVPEGLARAGSRSGRPGRR